jgi:Ca2+-binding EF-hand superfamily protein
MKFARSMLLAVSALTLAVGSAYGADNKRKGFNDLDKDKDGSLSKSEAAANPELKFAEMERNRDGKLTRAEYLRVMAAKDAGAVKRKVTGEDRKYPGFNDMDKDKDGALSRSEAKGNPQLTAKFKEADKNGDGKLARSEYLAVMGRQDAKTARAKVTGKDDAGTGTTAKAKSNDPGFNNLDKDHDGALSRTEAAGNAELVKKFKEADKNGDGKLTRAEYLSVMVKKDAKVVKEKVSGSSK